MMVMSCPFCGVSTHLPHETQEACIAALHEEIARLREIVDRLKTPHKDAILGDDTNQEAGADERG